MNWKTLAIGSALVIGSAGCDSGTTTPPPPPPEETNTYIVSTADIPVVVDGAAGREAVGFNLDDRIDDGVTDLTCEGAEDFTSPLSGETGVDNQLAANVIGLLESMLDGGVPGAIEEQIAAGTFLLLMTVTSNGLVNDTSVTVHLWLGTAPAAGVTVGADGRVTPGQSFTEMADLGTVTTARITAGRLSVDADELPLNLSIDGNSISLTLVEAHITGLITATGITSGEIGAQIQVADIVALTTELGLPVDEGTVRTIAQPDLDIDASMVCQAISTGLSFSAVSAANPS